MSLHSFNLSKLFPTCPALQNVPLPFAVDEMEFSNWVNTLTKSDDISKCRQILQVLQTLNTSYPPERKLIPGRTRLFFLEKLGAALTPSTTELTRFDISSDITTPDASEHDTANSEISAWSTFELGNAYVLLSQEDWFREEKYYTIQEKTLILTNGIQALGRGLLYVSQTYTKPHVHFWGRCFQFYRLAQLNRLLEPDVNPDAHSLDNAFKRVLVFALCNTNQFSPQEMRLIYELLGHFAMYAGLLSSVPKKKYNGIPSINLRGNGPPIIANESVETFNPDRLYIATVTVASKILQATYDKSAGHLPTDRLMLLRLAKTLTLNEQRKERRESAQGTPLGIIGFENIVEFLVSKQTGAKDVKIESRDVSTILPGEIRDLDLEIIVPDEQNDDNPGGGAVQGISQVQPPSAFQVIEFADPTDIWKPKKRLPNLESSVRLVDKSPKGYGLLWTDTLVKPKVGSIIGILHKTMTIGLIRWLVQSRETGMFIGVELLGGNAAVVNAYNPGFPDDEVKAVYLPGNDAYNQAASLVIMSGTFRPAEFIFLRNSQRNVRYRLVKQVHLTAYINHVEVVRSH